MREIKFRVWDKKRKEYFRISKLWNGDTDPSCFSADDWVDNYGNCGNMKDIVVEQYTGLHDKNGNATHALNKSRLKLLRLKFAKSRHINVFISLLHFYIAYVILIA